MGFSQSSHAAAYQNHLNCFKVEIYSKTECLFMDKIFLAVTLLVLTPTKHGVRMLKGSTIVGGCVDIRMVTDLVCRQSLRPLDRDAISFDPSCAARIR